MAELELRNLDIMRSKRSLIKSLAIKLNTHEIVAIIGNNGVGKTSLLYTIAGLLPAEKGEVIFQGRNSTSMSRNERARHLSLLLQQATRHPYCLAKNRIAHGFLPSLGFDYWPDQKIISQIKLLGERLAISHLLERPLKNLSGGEQRLIDIAKCLINPATRLILLDEPSVFLDATQKQRVASVLREQITGQRIVLFSSHDNDFIRMCATKALVISDQTGILSAL